MKLDRIHPGQLPRADDANKVAEALNNLTEAQGVGGVQLTNGPSGSSISFQKPITPYGESNINMPATVPTSSSTSEFKVGEVARIDTVLTPNKMFKETLLGVRPVTSGLKMWGICLDPLTTSRVGNLCVMGVCLARVLEGEGNGELVKADIDPGTSNYKNLKTGDEGPVDVLWKGPDVEGGADGLKWMLIRFPSGGSGGGELVIRTVDKFPAIPTFKDWDVVYHTGGGGIWWAVKGGTRWHPGFMWSTLSGNPGT